MSGITIKKELNMSKVNFRYQVQVQVHGCDKWYHGEGNTLPEALHVAVYACGDAEIRTQLVWVLSDEKTAILR